jgi:hypothetical protein
MPRTRLAKPQSSRTAPRTSSRGRLCDQERGLGPVNSIADWPCVPPRRKTRLSVQGESSAGGNASSFPGEIRELVLDDQRLRNDICWLVFDC